MNTYQPTYKPFGATAILMEWPANIDEAILKDIIAFETEVVKNEAVLDTIIAYNSLTIRYLNLEDFNQTVARLKELYAMQRTVAKQPYTLWQIPVCYHPDFGLDLQAVANQNNLSVAEVVQLHTHPTYLIYFLGFQPGFLYLGGLDSKIHTPRRGTPRIRIEKGAVGIGGAQTGVYPQDSAGGWNIIGKSPIHFFEVSKEQPCFAKAGDKVQFQSVDIKEFYAIAAEVKKGKYKLKSQTL